MRQHFRLLPALLVLSGASLSAQSASEMWRVEGTAHFEQLGEQVGYVADLNGDGFRDLLSQAPTASTGFLSRNGSLQARSGLDGSLLWRVDGTRDGQEWGTTVVRPGDVDGDGVDDFVVVEPVWSSASLAEAGRLTALSGKDGSVLWRREGGASYEGFGRVTKVGDDANGDGAKDILVGAMAASTGGLVENGYAMLLSGRTGSVLWMVAGLNNGEHFGEDIHLRDDFDGDGLDDPLVTSMNASSGGFVRNGLLEALSFVNGSSLWRLTGGADNENVGHRVLVTPDVTGDGVPDILTSSPNAFTNGLYWNGYAMALSGANGSLLWRIDGTFSNEHLGEHFVIVSDLDGDAVPDIVGGSPNASSMGLVENGELQGISGAAGTVLWSAAGTVSYGRLGTQLRNLGDVNGDGFDDVLSGCDTADTLGRLDNGYVVARSGSNGAILWRRDGQASGDHLGFTLATAGDLDGDGVEDVVTSSPYADGGGLNNAGRLMALSGAGGSVLWQVDGLVDQQQLGADILVVDDVDGDGLQDLFSFSPHADTLGLVNNGLVEAFSGATGAPFWRIDGQQDDEGLGAVRLSVDDHDGDGLPDLFLGSPSCDTGGLADNGCLIAISGGMALHLEVGPLVAGQAGTLTVSGFEPGADAYFLASAAGTGPTTLPQGVTVALSRPIENLGVETVNASGGAQKVVQVPPKAQGVRLWFQAIQSFTGQARLTNLATTVVQ